MRVTTLDRSSPEGFSTIHTVEQLGPNMSRTPSGNLVCRNVPLARVGWMLYGPNETPIKVGENGIAYVERNGAALFAEPCVTSFVGAAIVDEHPDDDVTPENWTKLAKGTCIDAWQGEGDDTDVVLGDLLITEINLINSILSGKREVSAGYDADYEQVGDGMGKQSNIIVNHIALVEKGRCGPRCSIGDHDSFHQPGKETPMGTPRTKLSTSPQRRVALQGLRQAVKDAEADLLAAEQEPDEEEVSTGDTHIHIHTGGTGPVTTDGPDPDAEEGDPAGDPNVDPNAAASGAATTDDPNEARFAAIEGALSELAAAVAKLTGGEAGEAGDSASNGDPEAPGATDPADTDDEFPEDLKKGDEDGKTKDSAALATGYQQVLARAEVLVPGFRMPTFDAKAKRVATIDAMCSARRKCLDAAFQTTDGAALITGITGKPTLDLAKASCKDVATIFNAAAGAKALLNNAKATKDSAKPPVAAKPTGPMTPAQINAQNAAFWAGRVQ